MNWNRIASLAILIVILLYGFFKIWFCRIYSIPVAYLIDTVGYSSSDTLDLLNTFSSAKIFQDHYLGWVIYYPTYLFFHLLFIYTLFIKKRRVRIIISLVLIVVIFLLVSFIFISRYCGWESLFGISYSIFQKLFSLPFILLAIEGGKILYTDIIELHKKK